MHSCFMNRRPSWALRTGVVLLLLSWSEIKDTYAPGLLVGVVPAEPADPEDFQAAGEELWVPLLGNAAL